MRGVPADRLPKQHGLPKMGRAALALYAALFIVGIILTAMVGASGEARVYQSRASSDAVAQEGVASWTEADPQAPLGYVERCSFRLGTVSPGTTTIGFFISNCYAEVKLDGSLVYSLRPSDSAPTVSPGNTFAAISIDGNDSGKLVEVELIPAARGGARPMTPTFYVGSYYKMFQHVLLADLPQIVLSIIALVVGILYLVVGIWRTARGRPRVDLALLGAFAALLGIWKLSDTRFAALLLPQAPRFVLTISLGALAFLPTLSLAYFDDKLQTAPHRLFHVASAFTMVCVAAVEILLATGVAGVRQTLYITHLSIVVTAIILVACMIRELRAPSLSSPQRMLIVAGLIVAAGSAVDFIGFYINESYAAGSIVELVVILIYVVVEGVSNSVELSQRASIDAQTGVANRSACFELLDDPAPLDAGVGLVMIDLNGLKETNDAQGHEAGDRMIERLAKALLGVTPRRMFLGRMGGDEFICVAREAVPEQLEAVIGATRIAIAKEGGEPLSFSAGWAISEQGETMQELFNRADAAMYREKQAFYQGAHDRRHAHA